MVQLTPYPGASSLEHQYYKVADPNSYLVITGYGIEKVELRKKAFIWPLQRCTQISITPFDFSLTLQAMTIEKLKFSLPAVFTIGPHDEMESLVKYAVLLTGESDGSPSSTAKGAVGTGRNHVQDIVKGIIEGETRSIVSTMTMEELFKERQVFKKKVIESVQSELDQFGLRIYNANVKELQDTPGSEYFAFLSRKAHEGALNQAKVDVADARMKGEVGEAEKQGRTKQEIAKIHAQTAVLETERKKEKATADAALSTKEIEIERELNLERISAKRTAERRDAELQKLVEEKRAEMEYQRLRATTVTQAKIAKDSAQEKADADLYTQQKKADGARYQETTSAEAIAFRGNKEADMHLYRKTKEAEGYFTAKERETEAAFFQKRREAEAGLISKQQEAEALLFYKQREAEAQLTLRTKQAEADLIAMQREAAGITEMAKAYGAMADVFGGPQGLLQYLMLKENTYEKLALANAKAINGLQPKINVWNTGNGGDGGMADPTAPIRNLFQSLPPLLSTIQDQTGISPPSWLAGMPQQGQQGGSGVGNGTMTVAEKKALVNGHK